MLGVTYLNEIVKTQKLLSPEKILEALRAKMIYEFKNNHEVEAISDGMDMSICAIDYEEGILEFAGANNHMVHLRNKQLTELKGTRAPIGYTDHLLFNYEKKVYEIEKNDVIYLYSDGYKDQFSEADNKKFKKKNFFKLLTDLSERDFEYQKSELENVFKDWKGQNEQTDDVLVIGIRL